MLNKNFIQRTISGAIFVAIIIASILLSPYAFAVVFVIITALAMHEFYKLTHKPGETDVNFMAGVTGGVLLFYLFVFICIQSGKLSGLPGLRSLCAPGIDCRIV